MLSYLGEPLDEGRLEAAGFADCLTKPVQQSHLLEVVLKGLTANGDRVEGGGGTVGVSRLAESPSTGIRRPLAEAGRKRARILLAEDNEVNQDLVAEILRDAHFDCEIVGNGKLAVQALLEQAYDLVLMDCHMPEMDGLQATQLIREKEQAGLLAGRRTSPLPIIALTANALTGDREACLRAGMTGYLSKPFYPEQVIQAVEVHLSATETTTATGQPAHSGGETRTLSSVPLNLKDLLRRCLGNPNVLERTVAKFQKRLPEDLRQIEQSLALGESSKLALLAHSLKGAAASLSAEGLQAAAARLEMLAKASDLVGARHGLSAVREECQRILQFDPRAVTPAPVG